MIKKYHEIEALSIMATSKSFAQMVCHCSIFRSGGFFGVFEGRPAENPVTDCNEFTLCNSLSPNRVKSVAL